MWNRIGSPEKCPFDALVNSVQPLKTVKILSSFFEISRVPNQDGDS
jgi:hypothetical protein